jgi:hypothetical protein
MRNAFLEAVSTHAPVVCDELHGEPFAIYRQLAVEHGVVLWRELKRSRPLRDEAFKPLRISLDQWASKRNINTDWCIESALRTLQVWVGAKKHKMRLQGLSWSTIQVSPPELPSYHPAIHTRPAYIADAHAAIDAYCNAVEAVQTSEQKEKKTLQTHLEWLVRKICLGHSYNSIARERNTPDAACVSRAVREIAILIALPVP